MEPEVATISLGLYPVLTIIGYTVIVFLLGVLLGIVIEHKIDV